MANGIEVKLNSNVDSAKAELQATILKTLEEMGLAAEGYAKVNLTDQKAVDTGALRNSVTHVVDTSENAVYVGTNMEYAPYIEFGTGIYANGGRDTPWSYQDAKGNWHRTQGQPARPFIVPAARDHTSEYNRIIKDNLGNAGNELK